MSNILVIKHGSLGDIAQASGAIQDIFENYNNDQIYLLTTKPYLDLFKKNPYIHDVILDKRLSRFNLIYLYLLMKTIKKLNFQKVFDLQNSSRTKFYQRILFPNSNLNKWSSSDTTLPADKTKEEFDKAEDNIKQKFVETLLGRRRNIWNVDSENHIQREAAKRMAINMPIQGTAAEMIKLAMLDINRTLESENYRSRMILQIHDELLFESPEEEIDKLEEMVRDKMVNAMPLIVPLVVDCGRGISWFDAH